MRIIIAGAAGRDYHDFNTVFRGRPAVDVVAFTRTADQNLGEVDGADRRYPASLAGEGYPDGIPIEPERRLEALIEEHDADRVVFSYSDVSHEHVMHVASRALAAGAGFRIIGPDEMMLSADVPVLAVDAVRTGCGKSQAVGALTDALEARGQTVRIAREPMPYGNLEAQRVQRFASRADLDAADCTIEEREEYEQHVDAGRVVFAGVDYAAVLDAASAEADVLLWDGGNNELPFFQPDVHVVLADPLRPGDETSYHPGETNLRLADCVLITKENSADRSAIDAVVDSVHDHNQNATVRHADSVVTVPEHDHVEGARVLAVEDGPTLTHGGADKGAASVAAEKYDAAARVDPRGNAVGSIADVLDEHPHLDGVLPAMGYSDDQIDDLAATIRAVNCDLVLAGTPHDLATLIDVDVPVVDVDYELELHDGSFGDLVDDWTAELGL